MRPLNSSRRQIATLREQVRARSLGSIVAYATAAVLLASCGSAAPTATPDPIAVQLAVEDGSAAEAGPMAVALDRLQRCMNEPDRSKQAFVIEYSWKSGHGQPGLMLVLAEQMASYCESGATPQAGAS